MVDTGDLWRNPRIKNYWQCWVLQLVGESPLLKPHRKIYCSRSGSVLHASIQNWINPVNIFIGFITTSDWRLFVISNKQSNTSFVCYRKDTSVSVLSLFLILLRKEFFWVSRRAWLHPLSEDYISVLSFFQINQKIYPSLSKQDIKNRIRGTKTQNQSSLTGSVTL